MAAYNIEMATHNFKTAAHNIEMAVHNFETAAHNIETAASQCVNILSTQPKHFVNAASTFSPPY